MQRFLTKYIFWYVLTGIMIVATVLVTRSPLASGLATFVGFLTIGSVTGTITITTLTDLRHVTSRLAEGNLDKSIRTGRSDEFGDVYRAVDDLRQSLLNRIEEAEERKAEAQETKSRAESLAEQRAEEKEALSEEVDRMVEAMDRFAAGDLTVQVGTEMDGELASKMEASQAEEIARLQRRFNQSVQNIRQVFGRLTEAIDQTDAVANRLAGSADQLNAGVQTQAQKADEAAAAMEQMARTIDDNAENATQTAEAAQRNGELAEENGEVVLEAVGKMEEIGDVVKRSAETVSGLKESSEEIGKIVATIDEIADQTNLLALNAAIEAARAGGEGSGKSGQGFAVVAEEVRELAERTSKATDEIEQMVGSVQEDTSEAVGAIEQGQSEVEAGIELAGQAADAFEEIVDSTGGITDRVDSIATATEEQAATGDQISESVQSISDVSDESAQDIEGVLQAAEELEELTGSLRGVVEEFHVGSHGGDNGPADRPQASSTGTGGGLENATSGDGAAPRREAPGLGA
ncbi:methyl-accepting chemotaxis protein [Salinibacter altiplanensis]|uniref:methyl-accepting chemotaxis protein n=1 Tax=Salinibacter altiplanensis TaxID=1803181 RepID=UPI000C9F6411|nr:methyl-accepting chemotaxis protein [Salinibacter altiplanensis]